jgi:hypothetical protein
MNADRPGRIEIRDQDGPTTVMAAGSSVRRALA